MSECVYVTECGIAGGCLSVCPSLLELLTLPSHILVPVVSHSTKDLLGCQS